MFIAFCLEIFYNANTIIFKFDVIEFFYQIMAESAGFPFENKIGTVVGKESIELRDVFGK